MVTVNINGQKVKVSKDMTLCQAAESVGHIIPTFCYDKRFEIEDKCGICIVECNGEKLRGCSTVVREGLEIKTHTPEIVKRRKEILESIIVDHPLDCLVCKKSGHCKLQDYCYEYGIEQKHNSCSEELPIDRSNPFYDIDPNKCISCGKCVAVCKTLQCNDVLTLDENNKKIKVAGDMIIDNSNCVFCGNCVSVCPVGALQAKEKTKYRNWEVEKTQTTCSYCGVGCQFDLITKKNKVVGVEPIMASPNDGLLCVKGKFGYKFIDHPDRLKTPLIKENGEFREASWKEAYELFVSKANKIKKEFGPNAIGGLSSARCTNEDNFLFQKFMRLAIKTNNIDHCARI